MILNNMLHLFQEVEAYNNYDIIENINDNIAFLTAASIENIPIFYRDNIIVIRQDFLKKMIAASKEDSVRAAVYIFLSMLVLHSPVVPISAHYRNEDFAESEYLSIACGNGAGTTRDVLRDRFGIHRNTIRKGMKLLSDVLSVIELPKTGYVFTYPANEASDKWSTHNLRSQLNAVADVIETVQHADFYSRINPDDYIGAEKAVFASQEDADYAIHNILDDPLVPQSWKEALTAELEKQEDTAELNLNSLAMAVTKLFADVPLVSKCRDNYFLIRQEILEFILLHGYLPTGGIIGERAMNKAASVILLYLITMTDELGAIYKDTENKSLGLMQMKDIAVDCDFKLPAVSSAMKYWMDVGIIKEHSKDGISGYKFSNQLWINHNGKNVSYLLHRQLLKEIPT